MKEEFDSNGLKALFKEGDRVYVIPMKMEATVIKQRLCYDGVDYCFWGNVELIYDDGKKGESSNWQLRKI